MKVDRRVHTRDIAPIWHFSGKGSDQVLDSNTPRRVARRNNWHNPIQCDHARLLTPGKISQPRLYRQRILVWQYGPRRQNHIRAARQQMGESLGIGNRFYLKTRDYPLFNWIVKGKFRHTIGVRHIQFVPLASGEGREKTGHEVFGQQSWSAKRDFRNVGRQVRASGARAIHPAPIKRQVAIFRPDPIEFTIIANQRAGNLNPAVARGQGDILRNRDGSEHKERIKRKDAPCGGPDQASRP